MQLIVQWVLCCRESVPLTLSISLSDGDVDFQIARNLFELTHFEFSVSWAKQREKHKNKTQLDATLHFYVLVNFHEDKTNKTKNNKKEKKLLS